MIKNSLFLVWLLLVVISCSSDPPFKNEPQRQPSLSADAWQETLAPLNGTLESQPATDKLSFYIKPVFKAQTFDKNKIRYVKMWVWGPGIQQKLWNSNQFVDVNNTKGATLEITGIPKGQNRLVTALAYDANQTWIPGAMLRAYYSSSANNHKLHLTLSWRFKPLGDALEALLAKGYPGLYSLNLDSVQSQIDRVLYGTQTPNNPFVVHPSRISGQQLAAVLESGSIPSPAQITPANPTTEMVIQNPQGGPLGYNATLSVSDPASGPFVVTAGTDRTLLSNIAIGTWPAVVTMGTANGTIQVPLTVTVDQNNNVSLSKGSPGNPLVMPPLIATVNNTYHIPAYPGLVGWWKGDGNANDSVATNHGTAFGNTVYAADKVGQSFQFDGNGDYVQIAPAAPLTMTNAVSMSVWIYPTGVAPPGCTTPAGTIVSKEGEYMVVQFSTGVIAWLLANTVPSWSTWINTGYTAPQNQWTHLVMTYSAADGRADTYANGTLVHTIAASGNIGDFWPAANELRMGGRQQCPTSDFFPGRVDEVQIYNRALTVPEIQALYAMKNITIQGDGFSTTPANNIVTLGTTPVTVTKATATTLTVSAPPTLFGPQTVKVSTLNQDSNLASTSLLPALDTANPKYGKSGDNITLNGSNFEPGNTTVKFNGLTAAIGGVTNSSLTATVPIGASNGLITLSTSGGTATGPNFAVIPSGMVGWWRADGTANDSGGSQNGTLFNGAAFGGGKAGQALQLLTGNAYVEIPDNPSLDGFTSATVMAWVKCNALAGRQGIVSKVPSGEYYLLIDGDRISFENNNTGFGSFKGATPLLPGNWYHVAVTYDGTNTRLYLNGNIDGMQAVNWNIPNAQPLRFGQRGSGGDFLQGAIDEVHIYNRNLSTAEIQTIYEATK